MRIGFSPQVKKELARIKKKDPDLNRKIYKQLKLFTINPTHPSLRLCKLSGNLKNFRSISISRGFRMVFQEKENDIAYFVDLGTHDEVYRR